MCQTANTASRPVESCRCTAKYGRRILCQFSTTLLARTASSHARSRRRASKRHSSGKSAPSCSHRGPKMARRCQALSRKLCSIYAGRPRDASVGLPPTMNVHNNIPSSGVTRQAAQRCARGARLREARGPDVTKRANRGWARWDKTVQLASLTSSYSSLQGADRDSGESVIQGPHGGVTKGGFLITHPSQAHAVSRRMPWKGGAHMREKSLSLGQHHCRDGSTRQGGVSSGARRQ